MLNELIYKCMGNLKYFSLLIAAGMFAACSDNLENAGNVNDGPKTGEGYVKVAINTPSVSSSRASFDDTADGTLVDGTSEEYAVDNAILVFFKGNPNNEANATFEKAYDLTKAELSVSGSDETPQVTEQVSVITEAPKVASSEQLYVLAILNYDTKVLNVENGSLKITNGPTLTGAYKLSELQKKISAAIDDDNKTNDTFLSYFTGSGKNKFTMTNAPLSDKSGSSSSNINGAKAYTLVPVKVYDTKAQATAGEVANIYVERVVAKVTLKSSVLKSNTTNQIEVTKETGEKTGDIVEITGWCLNVTNNSTKLVRDVNGFNNTATGWLYTTPSDNRPERFAGTKVIDASFGVKDESGYYRIYWAQDCNYYATGGTDATTVNTDFTTYTSSEGAFSPANPTWQTLSTTTADNACYCLENTMNFTEQKDDRTTGVLIKTNYWTKFGGEDSAKKRTFFICGTSSTKYPLEQVGESGSSHTKSFVDQIIEQANELITNDGYKLATTGAKGLSIKSGLQSGTYTDVTKVFTFAVTETTDSEKYKAQLAAVQAAVGGRISCYINGENFYYSSLIRHFYDDEGVKIPSTGVASADDYTLKHLGRYGVVRNNWYEIDINSVSGPGTPDVEAPEGNPDDSTEGYINCTINVLSWAKRSQGVDL